MLSSYLYAIFKLSSTTSPPKLFLSDCITLYLCILYLWIFYIELVSRQYQDIQFKWNILISLHRFWNKNSKTLLCVFFFKTQKGTFSIECVSYVIYYIYIICLCCLPSTIYLPHIIYLIGREKAFRLI